MNKRGLKLGTLALLVLQLCLAVLAQDQVQGLGASKQSPQTGQTGTGMSSAGLTAAKPGTADGVGNLQLGGVRRPLYRLNRSDVVELSFTLSPEFNQTLRVQPDGSLQPCSADAEALVLKLDLNGPKMVEWRLLWMRLVELTGENDANLLEELLGYPVDLPNLARPRPLAGIRARTG